MKGLVYEKGLQIILGALQQDDKQVLFKMKDGTLKPVDEVKDYSEVNQAIKDKVLNDMLLAELFGTGASGRKNLKKKHVDSFFSILRVVVDNSSASDLKEISKKYGITVKPGNDGKGKILSELLRE